MTAAPGTRPKTPGPTAGLLPDTRAVLQGCRSIAFRAIAMRLLDPDVGSFDHDFPALDLGRNVAAKLLGRNIPVLGAFVVQPPRDLRRRHRLAYLGIEPLHDPVRRARGRDHAVP